MLTYFSDSAVVIGASTGGIEALKGILSKLPQDFPVPILIAQHLPSDTNSILANILNSGCKLKVKEAIDKEPIVSGNVFLAPPNYHLLVEKAHTIALSLDRPVNWSRPSIDVLFESAAIAYKDKLIGILLTGASEDGALGLKAISENNGFTIVQNPDSAESTIMPSAGIREASVNMILSLDIIGSTLASACKRGKND